MTDYKKIFRESLDKLKNDGNYRIFADLEKIAGNFPQALNYKDNSVSEVTVWCSNDYLGMSQNDIVIESMIEAVKKVGAGSGGTRNISGPNHYHVLKESCVICIKKRQHCYLILDILPIKQHYLHLEKNYQIAFSFPMKRIMPQ